MIHLVEDKTRVLVVDDDKNMVDTLRDILDVGGYTVDVAYSGPEAIERIEHQLPDCVLMDLRMPDMNGVETFRELKQRAPDALVIFMTAYASSDLVDEAHDEGAVEVLPKPLDLERVMHLIEETTQKVPMLVIGDETASRHALGNFLSLEGIELRFAQTVDDAVLLFGQEPWRAVIVDMDYGSRIGVEGLKVIRELDPHADMILLSGSEDMPPETRHALEDIATSYFSHQDSADDIAGRVKQTLARQRLQHSPGPPRLYPRKL